MHQQHAADRARRRDLERPIAIGREPARRGATVSEVTIGDSAPVRRNGALDACVQLLEEALLATEKFVQRDGRPRSAAVTSSRRAMRCQSSKSG